MKYTVIYTVSPNTKLSPEYRITSGEKAGEAVYVPIDAVLGEKIEEGSEVKVIVIENSIGGEAYKAFAQKCIAETEAILAENSCSCEVIPMQIPFIADNRTIGEAYIDLLAELPSDSTILADITFGTKYITVLISCMLDYATRFLDCDVAAVLYGDVDWSVSVGNLARARLCDVTSVYTISSFSRYFGNSKEDYDKFLKGFIF